MVIESSYQSQAIKSRASS